jgi:xanthine dehydrogenase accessory factor
LTKFSNIFLKGMENAGPLALVTILETRGSVPQIPGASAVFSNNGLVTGTLGGGILEGDATQKAAEALKTGLSMLYEFELNADISAKEGAICGGTAKLIIESNPLDSREVFEVMENSIRKGNPGVMATIISGEKNVKISRYWFENTELEEQQIQEELHGIRNDMIFCLEERDCLYLERSRALSVFIEPVFPLPKLIIAGAGHIGKALAHMASLVDFQVTVIDDRPEYANQQNINEAEHIIVDSVGKAIREIKPTEDTYVVIVTRGHRDDGDALRECIGWDVPYIGMIGSKKKIKLMRENFISNKWGTADQLDKIHAPVGLDIGSKTVQEIAISICAQLLQVRGKIKQGRMNCNISAIILAAGESKRMGKPKMLLPFGDSSIIETVINNASGSALNNIFVVLGANADSIGDQLVDYQVETLINRKYKNGMLSSVQHGLKAVSESADAVMVLLGDQPMIGNTLMDRMIETYMNSGHGIIVATHQGKRGHPILFSSKYIVEVLEYSERKSLKDLLNNFPADVEEMETGHPEILRDIDTENDYQQELKYTSNHD